MGELMKKRWAVCSEMNTTKYTKPAVYPDALVNDTDQNENHRLKNICASLKDLFLIWTQFTLKYNCQNRTRYYYSEVEQ